MEAPNPALERPVTGSTAGRHALRRLWARVIDAPAYVSTAADRRTFSLVGLDLPIRATVVIVAVTFAILLDHTRVLIPADLVGRTAETMRFVALERALLFGIVPLALVHFAFRDRPSRYGLTLGEWRWGIGLIIVGSAIMTPIVLAFAQLPDARAYYAESAAPVADLIVTNTLDLAAAEFTYRGILMFTLIRAIGPVGVLVATMPFVFAHIGKPPLELFSTLGGGMVYGWLAWRTGSVVWGAIAHVYILTLVVTAAA